MGKKLISLLLTLLFIATVFTGCGAGERPEESSGDPVQEEPSTGEEVEEPSGNQEAETEGESEEAEQEDVTLSLKGPGNLMSNLLHDGTAAYHEGYVYHSDKMMYGNLMRTDVKTDETQLLVKGTLHDINVGDGRIFAVGDVDPMNPDDFALSGIFMSRLDGSDVRLLKEGYFEELVLYEEYLYFYDVMDGNFMRMKYDGTEETLLLEGAYPQIVILEGSLYIHASLDNDDALSYIYKMPLSGGEPQKVDPVGTFGGTIHVAMEDIIYISRNGDTKGMKRYDAETGEITDFLDTWISDIVQDEEWIYYYWSGVRQDNEDQGIYRSRPDGSEATLLQKREYVSSFNIAEKYLYYITNDEQRRVTRLNLETLEESFVPIAPEP
ncbi:DUF5050 domain-containing protein [Proteiniclasticum sp. C24MP]|uniref:DUF5050 domain-containing protein n=1 Tax=Proteiniclasticum sp. C24MP TaxID=3374101 RepID=UPI0037550663